MPYREGYYSICGECVNSTNENRYAKNQSNISASTTKAVQSTLTTKINISGSSKEVVEQKYEIPTSTKKSNNKTKEMTTKSLTFRENNNILHAPVETNDYITNFTTKTNENKSSKATVLHASNQTSSANKNLSTKSKCLMFFDTIIKNNKTKKKTFSMFEAFYNSKK